jgi:hypothetical protein
MVVFLDILQLNFGKILMSVVIVQYGFIPPFIDFNKTHATNPLWTGHARFHVVWQVFMSFFIALIALFFLWFHSENRLFADTITLFLSLSVLGSFFLNMLLGNHYGGTLSDSNGFPAIGKIDGNVLSFSIAMILLLVGYFLEYNGR